MSPADPGPITPIRSTQLGELANEVGHDTGIVERFVLDFLELLDQRLAAVNEALAEADDEGAITVLRSLETTGAMLGASELVDATAALRRAVRDDPTHLDRPLREFTARAEELRVRLTALSSALSSPYESSRGAAQAGAQAGATQSGSASR